MAAPKLTFSISGEKVSAVSGFDYIIVAFQSNIPYQAFECRATKAGEEYGVGKGALIASFSTPRRTHSGVSRCMTITLFMETGTIEFPSLHRGKTEAGTTTTIIFLLAAQPTLPPMGSHISA